MTATKVTTTVLISIVLVVILVAMVNIGFSIFVEAPQFDDFCDFNTPRIAQDIITQEDCTSSNGKWTPQNIQCVTTPCPQGFCNLFSECNEDYEEARDDYNQLKFYVFAGIGLVLLLIGLFTPNLIITITGLGTGLILMVEGIVFNLQDKVTTFVALLIIFVIIIFFAVRKIGSMK